MPMASAGDAAPRAGLLSTTEYLFTEGRSGEEERRDETLREKDRGKEMQSIHQHWSLWRRWLGSSCLAGFIHRRDLLERGVSGLEGWRRGGLTLSVTVS